MKSMILLFCLIFVAGMAWGGAPELSDLAVAGQWAEAHLSKQTRDTGGDWPFSFTYGGKVARELLVNWPCELETHRLDDVVEQRVITFTEPGGGLVVRCEAKIYADYPAVEWVLYFRNNGTKDTDIIEDVSPLDGRFEFRGDGPCQVHYSLGSQQRPDDFAPKSDGLSVPLHLAPVGGRSSDGVLPFFHLTPGDGDGLIVGIGWTGQWAATFSRTEGNGIAVQAGMERTHLRLHPDEETRTPAILLVFRSGGDASRGQNVLRSLLLKHYTPRPNGNPVEPPIAASPHGIIGFSDSTEANMVEVIERIAKYKLPVDTFWIDAGWNGDHPEWARSVGSWEPNATRFPRGLKPVADAAHSHGLRFLLWFEPERVMPGTWLYENHADWLLRPAGLPNDLLYQEKDGFHLLNLGNPNALAWAKQTLSSMIRDIGIDIYRQDFNMSPLFYWRNGEAEDRQGMNEIRHVMGLYDLYDSLMKEHPGLLIDNCASGGRRIDFEIMRRALTLFRSDLCWEPVPEQAMNQGLSPWMPITGVGAISTTPYDFLSGAGVHMSLALNFRDDRMVWESAKAQLEALRPIRHLFTADFYSLTPYSLDDSAWMACQYHDPVSGQGLVLVFRRPAAPVETSSFCLRALQADRAYTVKDLNTAATTVLDGRTLESTGLSVTLGAPGATLLHYSLTE